MAERDNNNQQSIILNGVDDSVGTNANSQGVPALQCLRTRRTRVDREQRDCSSYAGLILPIDLL